ncbi:hypothetical protein BC941DRAFT_451687 [Chlamydoabsidia padenii]|nr:hypothetical protein BC941DRAFT_451687 [Chlamydoabsidia padenii]
MTTAIDDYWKLKEKGHSSQLQDDRHVRKRHNPSYYRDEPPTYQYTSSSLSRNYNKPDSSNGTPSYYKDGFETPPTTTANPNDDNNKNIPTANTSGNTVWQDRDYRYRVNNPSWYHNSTLGSFDDRPTVSYYDRDGVGEPSQYSSSDRCRSAVRNGVTDRRNANWRETASSNGDDKSTDTNMDVIDHGSQQSQWRVSVVEQLGSLDSIHRHDTKLITQQSDGVTMKSKTLGGDVSMDDDSMIATSPPLAHQAPTLETTPVFSSSSTSPENSITKSATASSFDIYPPDYVSPTAKLITTINNQVSLASTTKGKEESTTSNSKSSHHKHNVTSQRNLFVSSLKDDTKENAAPILDEKNIYNSAMSQQQIVLRIDEIENDITKYEKMLSNINKRQVEQNHQQSEEGLMSDTKEDTKDDDIVDEETAKKQILQQMMDQDCQPLVDIQHPPPTMRRQSQVLMDQIRTHGTTVDRTLYDQVISANQRLALKNSCMKTGWQGKLDNGWYDNSNWAAPIYDKLEDYPCYKKNLLTFDKLKVSISTHLVNRNKRLLQKQHRLKREFKSIYIQWRNKNRALDRRRDQERQNRYGGYKSRRAHGAEGKTEEYTDGVIFTGSRDALRFGDDDDDDDDGATLPFGSGNGWASDVVHSQTGLLDTTQTLDNADIRNPELRAAKTTAIIPPMILDSKGRSRTFDNYSGLVKDPLAYYLKGGTEIHDLWNQQEMTAFMESYMQYPKRFDKVAAAVGTKTTDQCILFYYKKKTKIDFKALMRKRKRGKNRKRDNLAAAIKRASGDTFTTTRRNKNKGSALMADIGQAQVSQRTKEKQTKSREQRELEKDNAYWEGVAERRRKANQPTSDSNITTSTGYNSTGDSSLKQMVGKRRTLRSSLTKPDYRPLFPDILEDDQSTVPPAPPKQSTTSSINNHQHDSIKKDKGATDEDTVDIAPPPSFTTPLSAVDKINSTRSAPQTTSHRRSRTMSSLITKKEEWANDYSNATAHHTPTPDIKRGSSSSYWSVSERGDFIHFLKMYGRDWTRIANNIMTKTATQVRNYYHNNEAKMGLDKLVNRHEECQPIPSHTDTHTYNTALGWNHQQPPLGSAFDLVKSKSNETSVNQHPHHRPLLGPSGRDILNPSSSTPATVTRISDLLNTSDEPSIDNWETWFGL